MTFKHFSRLLFAGTAISALALAAGVDGFRADARAIAAASSQSSADGMPGDESIRRMDQSGMVLAQAERDERLRRRDRDNPGERPGNRQERRDDRREERQQDQDRQRGQERQQQEQRQLERPRNQDRRQQEERQQLQQRERQQDRERQQQLERRQDLQRQQRELSQDRERRLQQQQRLPDQLRIEQRERLLRGQEQPGGVPDRSEGQQYRDHQLRERQLGEERRQQQQRQELRRQEQERDQRERQRQEQQGLRQQERLQEQRQQEREREQRQQERVLEQRRQDRQEQRQLEQLRERRERFGGRIGDRRDMRVDELRALRRERVEQGGRRTIIEEQDRVIVREGNRTIIRHDETDRFRRAYGDAQIRRERRGQDDVTIVRRPNGVEIITVRDQNGNILRRIRREPAGRQVVLFENIAPRQGSGTMFEEVVVLPPPRVVIPRERYIVDVERATQEDLYEAFTAPPVERIERTYTLDQVRQSPALRDRVRRVDIDTVTFDFGSWELSEEQARALTGVGEALRRAIEQNPSEVFLIEGHTDAVGNEVDNLTLSDRRAETVATILTEMFNVPAENLTTQGYGEQYLKVSTEEPERQNRRVTIRRITPLLRNEARQ
jgi:outer membrane protein OmpA-like peptidoglycan-associated protein